MLGTWVWTGQPAGWEDAGPQVTGCRFHSGASVQTVSCRDVAEVIEVMARWGERRPGNRRNIGE